MCFHELVGGGIAVSATMTGWMMRVTSQRSLVEGVSMGVRETTKFFRFSMYNPNSLLGICNRPPVVVERMLNCHWSAQQVSLVCLMHKMPPIRERSNQLKSFAYTNSLCEQETYIFFSFSIVWSLGHRWLHWHAPLLDCRKHTLMYTLGLFRLQVNWNRDCATCDAYTNKSTFIFEEEIWRKLHREWIAVSCSRYYWLYR